MAICIVRSILAYALRGIEYKKLDVRGINDLCPEGSDVQIRHREQRATLSESRDFAAMRNPIYVAVARPQELIGVDGRRHVTHCQTRVETYSLFAPAVAGKDLNAMTLTVEHGEVRFIPGRDGRRTTWDLHCRTQCQVDLSDGVGCRHEKENARQYMQRNRNRTWAVLNLGRFFRKRGANASASRSHMLWRFGGEFFVHFRDVCNGTQVPCQMPSCRHDGLIEMGFSNTLTLGHGPTNGVLCDDRARPPTAIGTACDVIKLVAGGRLRRAPETNVHAVHGGDTRGPISPMQYIATRSKMAWTGLM